MYFVFLSRCGVGYEHQLGLKVCILEMHALSYLLQNSSVYFTTHCVFYFLFLWTLQHKLSEEDTRRSPRPPSANMYTSRRYGVSVFVSRNPTKGAAVGYFELI